jgi:hypothetical protein
MSSDGNSSGPWDKVWLRVYLAGNMEWLDPEDSFWRPSTDLLRGDSRRSARRVLDEIGETIGNVRFVLPTEAGFDHGGDVVQGIVTKDVKLLDGCHALIAVFTKRDQVGTLIEALHAANSGKDLLIFIAGLEDPESGVIVDSAEALERLGSQTFREVEGGVNCRGDTDLWFLTNYFKERPCGARPLIDLGGPRVKVIMTKSQSIIELAPIIESWLKEIRRSVGVRQRPETAPRPPPTPLPSPAEWFSEFSEGFYRASLESSNPVGLHYLKRRIRRRVKASDAEWTELVRGFLAQLAWKKGYWQEWEREKRTDVLWYEWDASNPTFFIEHEHVSKSIPRSEVAKALSSDAEFKIVFTYFDRPDVTEEGILGDVEKVIEATIPDGAHLRFLLVIGDKKTRSPLFWWGYSWDSEQGKLLPAIPGIKAVRCQACKAIFQPWGEDQKTCIECEFKEATDSEILEALAQPGNSTHD